jgi:hypothetical protein
MKKQNSWIGLISLVILSACQQVHPASTTTTKPASILSTVVLPQASIASLADIAGTWTSTCHTLDTHPGYWTSETLVISNGIIMNTQNRYSDAACLHIYSTLVFQSSSTVSASGTVLNQVFQSLSVVPQSYAAGRDFEAAAYCKKTSWYQSGNTPTSFSDVTLCGEPATSVSAISVFGSKTAGNLLIRYAGYSDYVKYSTVTTPSSTSFSEE